MIFCLHRGSSLVGKTIRWFTRSEYSHVSVILPDGRHVESREGKGVIAHPRFSPKAGEVVEFFALEPALSSDQIALAEDFVRETLGEPYDWMMVGAFVWRGHATKASKTAWFCSEWAFTLACRAGVKLLRLPEAEAFRVDPERFSLSPFLVPIPHHLSPKT